jgi:hypothetical protein
MTTPAGSDRPEPTDSARSAGTEGFLVRRIKTTVDWLGQGTAIAFGFYSSRADILREDYDQARVDRQIVKVWILLIICYAIAYFKVPYTWPTAVGLSALRIVNIIFWNLRAALVETGKTPTDKPIHSVTSTKRSLVFGMVNFLELIVAFACLYAAFPCWVHLPCKEVPTFGVYLYFSSMTQLTVGYGDVTPLSWMRLVAVIQALSGLALLTVTISRFLAHIKVKEIGRR